MGLCIKLSFPDGSDVKESACNVGDLDSAPELGRYPGRGHGTHSSFLAWRIPMDRGIWQATVHGVAKSQTRLSDATSQVVLVVKNQTAMQETFERGVLSLGQDNPLEKGMATPSSILAWRIPWTEVLGGLQSMGSQRIRHD